MGPRSRSISESESNEFSHPGVPCGFSVEMSGISSKAKRKTAEVPRSKPSPVKRDWLAGEPDVKCDNGGVCVASEGTLFWGCFEGTPKANHPF